MTTQQARCVHDQPRTADRCLRMGRKPHDAGRCGVQGWLETLAACEERRNGRSSVLGSRSSGDPGFTGRFNIETFIVAPGVGQAPNVHNKRRFPDASSNPSTAPVHPFHLGLWFNGPADAARAGCPNSVTPFNGDHNAGIQVLSTRNFGKLQGLLRQLKP